MKTIQKLNELIQKLQKCQTNQRIASAQNFIVVLLHQCLQSQIIQCMNVVIQKMNDFNFRHVFRNLFSEIEFMQKHQTQLGQFLIDRLTIQPHSNLNLSKHKKLLLLQLLFNYKIQQSSDKTLFYVLRKTRCYNDLKFCHSFLWTVNQTFTELNQQDLQLLDLNQVSLLVFKVIKSWHKVPDYLLDQALRFVNYTIIPDILTSNNPQSQQVQQLITLILNCVILILQKNIYKIGNTYKFLSLFIKNHKYFGIQMNDQMFQKIVSLCRNQIQYMFPNLQNLPINALQTEIQKLQQHSKNVQNEQQNQQQLQKMKDEQKSQQHKLKINKIINEPKFIESNLSIKILKGISSFISQLFLYLTEQYQKKNQRNSEIIEKFQQNNTLTVFKKVFQLLSFCNDKQIFSNFIQVHHKRQMIKRVLKIQLISISEEQLMKYIMRNCPTPCFDNVDLIADKQDQIQNQIKKQYKHKDNQQQYVFQCIQGILKQWITQQEKLNKIFELIKHKIDKQYDQAFNSRQFQSACNALILAMRLMQNYQNQRSCQCQNIQQSIMQQDLQQYNKTLNNNKRLSKDEVIEWIKALLNLNESCLPIHRKIIVSKTYQILSQVYETILPGNQYLQQVIQNELITKSYPQKKQHLSKLITFYQKHGDSIFEMGYKNKIQLRKFNQTINLLYFQKDQTIQSQQLLHQYQQTVNFQKEGTTKQKIKASNSKFRIYKLLDRLYKKLQVNQLQLKDRIHLWTLIVRVYKMNSQQQDDQIVNIRDTKKMFSSREDILLARHLARKDIEQKEVRQILKVSRAQLQKLGNKFKQYPFYYENQLKAYNKMN